eukprot:12307369-Alexandrium_andersonii.AAC.1
MLPCVHRQARCISDACAACGVLAFAHVKASWLPGAPNRFRCVPSARRRIASLFFACVFSVASSRRPP